MTANVLTLLNQGHQHGQYFTKKYIVISTLWNILLRFLWRNHNNRKNTQSYEVISSEDRPIYLVKITTVCCSVTTREVVSLVCETHSFFRPHRHFIFFEGISSLRYIFRSSCIQNPISIDFWGALTLSAIKLLQNLQTHLVQCWNPENIRGLMFLAIILWKNVEILLLWQQYGLCIQTKISFY